LYFFYWFWNCCDSAVFFVFFSIGFGTVATAWYFLYFFLLYHAVATVPKPIEKIQKIPRCRNSSKINRKKYHAVATVQKPIEKVEKIPRCRNSYTTNTKNAKNTTLSQQFQNQ
jgi:predicted Co/Zn/Cd cation transporter (cation efflux family)